MANLTAGTGGAGGVGGVPALKITTEHQAIVALGLELGLVLVLGVIADQGGGWAVSAGLILLALFLLFLMGNFGALKSHLGGVFE